MEPTADKLWKAIELLLNNFIARLPSLVLATVVFAAFYVLSYFAAQAIQRTIRERNYSLAVLFARLARGVTVLFGLMVAISIVAPSFQASDLIKTLGIGGVAIGFAFQNILQNFVAGIILLWTEPFHVGDEIKIDAYEGTVEEIQARATIINTYDERQVVIPNGDLFTHSVIVNTARGSSRWQYDVEAGKNWDVQELKETILSTVRRVPGVLSRPAPEVLVVDIGPDKIKVRVLWSTHDSHQHQMLDSYDQVLTALFDALNSTSNLEERNAAA
jgi:small-conductance mechanosensitive channel